MKNIFLIIIGFEIATLAVWYGDVLYPFMIPLGAIGGALIGWNLMKLVFGRV